MKKIFEQILNHFKKEEKVTPVSAKEEVLNSKTKMPSYKESVDLFKKEEISIASDVDLFKQNIEQANLNQRITETAYFLWEKAGRPENKDLDFWAEAEKIVSQESETKWV